MVVSRTHGYTPFTLLYKQDLTPPCVPWQIAAHHPLVWDVSLHDEAVMVEDLVGLFWEAWAIATKHLY